MTPRTRRGLLGLLAGGALALLAGRWLAGLYADRAFYHTLGLDAIWHGKFVAASTLAASAFVLVSAFTFANLFAVRQSIVSLVLPRQVGDLEVAEAIPTARLTLAAAVIALTVGALFALLPHDWSGALLAWDGVAFGEFEPYLERDLGFYVAWLPFERGVQERSTAVVGAVTMLVLIAYGVTPSIRWTSTGLYVSTWVRRHLAVLAGLLVLLVGWDWRLDRYERLSAGSGLWAGVDAETVFSAFDHRIALPYLAIASFMTMPIAAVLMWAGWKGYLRLGLAMLSVLLLGGPVAGSVLPLVARPELSTPEARRRERPYLTTVGHFTRRAFGVDAIAGHDTVALATLPLPAGALQVSAWDPAALGAIATESRRGGIPAGVAWRATPAGLEATPLRQPEGATAAAARWPAEPVVAARADDAGRPYATSALGRGRLDGVLVHPGARSFALIADSSGRVVAPAFERTLERVALAWDLQDPRLMFRELPSPRPKLLTTRDVRQRVRRAAPFVAAGPTVTPLLRGDSLYWFVELFVTARRYPLSMAVTADGRDVQYARHAATAVVQAQTGRVMLVPSERPDPVMQRWMRRFSTAFTPLPAAPEWLRRERPPAVDEMLVQGGALARVGFVGDSLGRRRLARPDDADAELLDGGPLFFQLDSLGTLGWSVPVDIPWAGQTLGVLVARGGVERRTEYHDAPGPRWTSVLEAMQQEADRAGFGGGRGSIRRGRVQAIPTPDGAAWVQSYYEWPADAAPRLAGVVVLQGERVRSGRTLADALGLQSAGPPLAPDAFRERVARLYDAMQAAQRAGDWRAYGEAWAALGRLLGRP